MVQDRKSLRAIVRSRLKRPGLRGRLCALIYFYFIFSQTVLICNALKSLREEKILTQSDSTVKFIIPKLFFVLEKIIIIISFVNNS